MNKLNKFRLTTPPRFGKSDAAKACQHFSEKIHRDLPLCALAVEKNNSKSSENEFWADVIGGLRCPRAISREAATPRQKIRNNFIAECQRRDKFRAILTFNELRGLVVRQYSSQYLKDVGVKSY